MKGKGSFLLIAAALMGFTDQAEASTQRVPGVGTEEMSLEKRHQGLGQILFGRLEKIENTGFVVESERGEYIMLRLSKGTNVVCLSGSEAKLVAGRHGISEQSDVPLSPAGEEQVKKASRTDDQRHASRPYRQDERSETPAPSSWKSVAASSDEAASQHVVGETGFLAPNSDCHFKAGDLVRIEASDAGTMTTITRLVYDEQ
jgi:hypothetical protein